MQNWVNSLILVPACENALRNLCGETVKNGDVLIASKLRSIRLGFSVKILALRAHRCLFLLHFFGQAKKWKRKIILY